MAGKQSPPTGAEPISHEKQFITLFQKLCTHRSAWQVWADFITAAALSIANALDKNEAREKECAECIARIGTEEVASELFSIVVQALEENPRQDFLGTMYMNLELGSHWKGQFFTPYNICELMAAIGIKGKIEEIEAEGWTSVNDCACGAGATLIAMANKLHEAGVNYQQQALFVAQDIDRITGMMCYVQLSLLGCAGYVVIADTLSNPVTGNSLKPEAHEGQEFWFTPMYYSDVWNYRRLLRSIFRRQG